MCVVVCKGNDMRHSSPYGRRRSTEEVRMKRITIVAALIAGAAVAAIFGVFGAHGTGTRTGPLVVRAGLEAPPGNYVRGDGLYAKGARAQLGAPVSGALMGPLSPVAVTSPDGRLVAYNSWRELRAVDDQKSFSRQGIADGDALGTPSLRVNDERGRDFLLERGAYSAAWRRDGAIAFVRGVDPDFRAGRIYEGDVVVQPGVHGHGVVWTSAPARYVVYAWAGDRLLFYRIGEGETLQLLVADGPGKVRALAEGSAIAVSPDGTRVAVASADSRSVRVLDVATGAEHGWLDLTTTSPQLAWVGYSGSWTDDHVVAAANPGLAIFRVGADSIELEQVLSVDHAEFPVGLQEPRFADEAGDELVATADVPPAAGQPGVSYFLSCDRKTRTCKRGESAPARGWQRLVENPSRPKGGSQ
jgi:hypothetical protein